MCAFPVSVLVVGESRTPALHVFCLALHVLPYTSNYMTLIAQHVHNGTLGVNVSMFPRFGCATDLLRNGKYEQKSFVRVTV